MIECIADRLDLRQDQTPLGGLKINGNDQQNRSARRNKVTQKRRRYEPFCGDGIKQGGLEGVQHRFAFSDCGVNDILKTFFFQHGNERVGGFAQVGLGDDTNRRKIAFPDFCGQ